MTATSFPVPSFCKPHSFSFILRGRKVILGQIEDVHEGDLRVSGSQERGFLQIRRYTPGLHSVKLGGRWEGRFHYNRLTFEEIERVECALMRLAVNDWFIVVSAEMVMTLTAPEPARPVAEFLKRLMGKPKSQPKAHKPKRKSVRGYAEAQAA